MLLAVAGSVVLMTGVLLGAVSGVLDKEESRGWPAVTVIALGLIASGLVCGALVVAIAVPRSRRVSGHARRPARLAPPSRLPRRSASRKRG